MNKNIYKNYTDTIREALINGRKRGVIEKTDTSNFIGLSGIDKTNSMFNKAKDELLYKSLEPLSGIAGKKAKYHEKPGAHPDFTHLKQNNSVEYHYITSMFIDIKNSTGLFKKYDPYTVANITTTIQRAAIHTCWYFDGFVQRFHGDGLFVYFGGKNMTLQQSVTNAINASSFFSYFIQNDLKKVFLEQGVEDIYTRIGIDTGDAPDVLWHLAGMNECSEITTCSLHTSLASKMQGNANSNGIMLGDNVKNNSGISTEHFNIKINSDKKEERYIFQIPEEKFNYSQWEFNWNKYLQKHPSITADENGNLFFKQNNPPVVSPPKLNTDFLKQKVDGYRPYFK